MGKIKKFSGYLLNEDELQTYLNLPIVHNFIEDVTRRVRHFHCEEKRGILKNLRKNREF